ncbi:MAG: hypothetical protein AAF806_03720 [Bacteroidota bacterium]
MTLASTQAVGMVKASCYANRGPVLGDILGPRKGPVLGDILGPF